MEKYYKVRESVLLDLLEKANRFDALKNGGVDNWMWYGDSYCDFLRTYCEDNGIDPEQIDEREFDFFDIAKSDLGSFEEI